MQLLFSASVLLGVLALYSGHTQAAEEKKPCTAHSSKTTSFYDLRPLSLHLPVEDDEIPVKGAKTESWKSSGYDYGTNFSINICAPVLEEVHDVVGLNDDEWRNVSAYYTMDGKTYSMGQESSNLTFRGRKLVLQYTNGSPCGSSAPNKKQSLFEEGSFVHGTKEMKQSEKDSTPHGRKSTTISFLCEKDALVTTPVISFVGTDPDECAYFFEIRSQAACGGAEPVQQGVGPGGVFGIIMFITIAVYFIGGVMYQRSVAHARGWRQLPNYSMWAGIGSFFKDMLVIATSSCARCMPSRRGYRSVSTNGSDYSRGRNGRPEDENRLIDQLDEEWDD